MKKFLMGKTVLSVLLAGSMMNASATEQEGTISFRGFIYNATCSIELNDNDSQDADVFMGRYPTSEFTHSGAEVGGEDGHGSLDISLRDCPDKGIVTLQLHGQQKDDNHFILELDDADSSETAQNIGISLYDRDNMDEMIVINGSVTKEYEVDSSAEWHANYVAKYISTSDDVEAGQADATLNYTLSYN